MLVGIWYRTPVMMLIIYTGLLTVSRDLIEAAMIDGASLMQVIFRIKIPLIRPVIMVAVLFQTIDQAKWFDGIYILTRGGPGIATETLSVFTYIHGFGFLRMGYASAAAILLSLFIGILTVFVMKIGGVQLD
jgi:multiple sugar transport system permease protein